MMITKVLPPLHRHRQARQIGWLLGMHPAEPGHWPTVAGPSVACHHLSEPGAPLPLAGIWESLLEGWMHKSFRREWQQSADARFTNLQHMMQQQHNDLKAYFHFVEHHN
uniref:Uncharacterized protein n=1 Tax=Leersia perrieri TaxID=77586 RepID=A0A0D9WXX7_9ORYZ